MSYESVYSHACSLFDMESLIAYFAVQTYINNSAGDWPRTNIALWRAKKTSEEPYQDGKWRWMLYDLNGGVPMEFSRVNDDTIKYLLDNSLLFKNLWEQPDFKQEFLQRLGKIKELLSGAIVAPSTVGAPTVTAPSLSTSSTLSNSTVWPSSASLMRFTNSFAPCSTLNC